VSKEKKRTIETEDGCVFKWCMDPKTRKVRFTAENCGENEVMVFMRHVNKHGIDVSSLLGGYDDE